MSAAKMPTSIEREHVRLSEGVCDTPLQLFHRERADTTEMQSMKTAIASAKMNAKIGD